jgi:RNA polymerase sigma-54 factor
MGLEQRLSLRLSQRLVMTPSLQQAIKLLQMTRLELESTLTQELVENPVLEEREDDPVETVAGDREEPVAPVEGEIDHKESMAEIDLEAYFNDYWEGSTEPYNREDRELPPLENTLSRQPDLYDHLLWQLRMAADVPPRLREIAELVIGNLAPDGFLVATAEEIRAMGDAGEEPYTLAEVEEALELVRTFDPPGVGCANLQECLQRQLMSHDNGEVAELARRVVTEAWDLFLKRQFPAVAKKLGIDLPPLEAAIELIKALETRPGRAHNAERTQYVEPDVAVVKVGDDYVVQLNDDGLPRLRVSRAYRRMLAQLRAEGRQNDAQQFIKDKMRSAVWLIKSLDQRQRTIYKVTTSIVRQQRDFLDRGIEYLRPMVLRDVAEDIGMHESTVSRVVSNKYVHTPRGLFPLKFFFHSGIDREYGEDISSLTVKRKIRSLIGEEDARRPLSDSDLMKVLNREGINIARRTVAKYREELHIPSSNDRRQVF